MLRLAVVAIICLMSAREATAQVRTLARHGAWEAYVALSDNRTPLCGMMVIGDQSRSLHIKWFRGTNLLTIQAFKRSWSIPPNTRIPVTLRVDNHEGWEAPRAIGDGTMVEWAVTMDTFREFSMLFRAGLRMTVSFPNGSEPPWTISLIGSSATYSAFAGCIVGLTTSPTQPHGGR